MTNYYIEKDNKILLFDEDKQKLQDTIAFMPQYADLPILETDRPIVDFEFADTPEWIANHLREVKETKMQEALDGAKSFIENEACYQFDENNSIEATDGNIGKLTAYALGFSTGAMQEVQWTSKEDNALTLDPDDLNRFKQAVIDFLTMLRRNNPDSHIVWVYGMLGYDLTLAITDAMNSYRNATKDNNVAFLHLPNTTDETVGSHAHPGEKSHARAAKVLTEYLKAYLEA